MVAETQNALPPSEPAAIEGIKVAIHPEYPEQTVTIGGSLSEKGIIELCNQLKDNLDIFAWKPADMTGVPRSIVEHRLNVRKGCQPIRQKRRGQAPNRNKAIQEEVTNLVEAKIMREVHYHDWLSNPVMCFLDAYKGYHQIQMAKKDEEKTVFHTNQGVFCYTKMSFGLKNAGATYQRLVDKAFEKQIGKNLEVYVYDLVIKSHTECEILKDVEETFHNLRRINMKLNPKKCMFGAEEGVFLGHVVSMQGIKTCLEKAEAMMKLQSPQTLKEAQSLNKNLASLNRFLSKSGEKSLPFFKTLKREAILSRPENKGRMLKWKFELEAFDITYRPRISIRGQILANFITERPDEEVPSMEVQAEKAIPEPWTLFTDGSSCLEGSGARLILTSPEGEEFTYALRFEFDASNNEAEYEALVASLRIAEQMGVKNLIAKVDSCLVANKINGLYEAKEQSMTQYLEKAKTLIDSFEIFSIELVSRSENKKANTLSKIASTSFAHLTKQVLVETLKRKSIEEREILVIVEEEGYCSMTPLVEYLTECTLSEETKKARAIKRIDISCPFTEAQVKVKFLIIAIDNFTKWIKAKLVATITGDQVKKSIRDNIAEKAAVREARNKARMEKYYNTKVRSTSFRPRDFVYRSNEASYAKESKNLDPKWEGPYKVIEALGKGAYKLRNRSGDVLPRTWNI
ncbi:reverse transcriptase domain-containing protein [Tanacetum coccineum]